MTANVSYYCSWCGTLHAVGVGCVYQLQPPLPSADPRRPFRCPVCDGRGKIVWPVGTDTGGDAPCHACAGTGIVWGPPT